MDSVALLFAGQGSQYPGMGKDFYETNMAARAVFDSLETLRPGTLEQCWNSTKEQLAVTEVTQPCMFVVDYAIAKAVEAAGIPVAAVAGFSLGEIPALGFAGVLSEADAFALVCKRAELMQKAAEARPGGMQAVVKLSADVIEELAARFDAVFPVNYNSPEQTAVAGSPAQLKEFADVVKAAGGRAVPLAVSGAFHSPFMDSAADGLERYLKIVSVQNGKYPVYANYAAAPYTMETAKEWMAAQVNHPVRWVDIILQLQAQGIRRFVEVGPGKTLSGLVKKIMPDAEVFKVETTEDLQQLMAAVSE